MYNLGQVGFLQPWGYLSYTSGRQLDIWGRCFGEMREDKTTTASPVVPKDQRRCNGRKSRWAQSSPRRETGHSQIHKVWRMCKSISILFPRATSVPTQWDPQGSQKESLRLISLLLSTLQIYLRQPMCPNMCSRPRLWDPCPHLHPGGGSSELGSPSASHWSIRLEIFQTLQGKAATTQVKTFLWLIWKDS